MIDKSAEIRIFAINCIIHNKNGRSLPGIYRLYDWLSLRPPNVDSQFFILNSSFFILHSSFKWICRNHLPDDFPVGLIDGCHAYRLQIDLGGLVGVVPHALADDGYRDIHV